MSKISRWELVLQTFLTRTVSYSIKEGILIKRNQLDTKTQIPKINKPVVQLIYLVQVTLSKCKKEWVGTVE